MPAAHETAYPRLKECVTPPDLAEVYTPTAEELALAMNTSTRPGARLGFLVLLKTFQRLGYFMPVGEVPKLIVENIAQCLGADHRPERLLRYDESGTRRRHIRIRGRPNSLVTKGHLETRRENCSANTGVFESPSRFACRKTRRTSQRFCVRVLRRGNPTGFRGCVRIAKLTTFATHGSWARNDRFKSPNGPW
jgi:hypothetical protein